MPDLRFEVVGAGVLEFAAAPSLLFKLKIENRGEEAIRSITLNTQIRIAPEHRHYSDTEQEALRELFGEADRWGSTLKSLLWAHTVLLVPPFTGSVVVDMPVPCVYDFEVISAKYFHALEDREAPLEFLFSGSMFYAGATGLQVEQIPWDKEAHFRMPVQIWKDMMDRYFPNSAWLRLRRDLFDRLYQFRSQRGLPTWEAALEQLLQASEEDKR